ncbi:hypothetical protein CDAR_521011, partial [Caerostris darwini]
PVSSPKPTADEWGVLPTPLQLKSFPPQLLGENFKFERHTLVNSAH